MKTAQTQIPEDANWADYCDALDAESWLRLDTRKWLQHAGRRAPAAKPELPVRREGSAEGADAAEKR